MELRTTLRILTSLRFRDVMTLTQDKTRIRIYFSGDAAYIAKVLTEDEARRIAPLRGRPPLPARGPAFSERRTNSQLPSSPQR